MQFRHKKKEIAEEAANIIAAGLRPFYLKYMTGPAEPIVNRIRDQYLFDLLLKFPKDTAFIATAKNFIHEQIAILHHNKRYSGVTVMTDVDPM